MPFKEYYIPGLGLKSDLDLLACDADFVFAQGKEAEYPSPCMLDKIGKQAVRFLSISNYNLSDLKFARVEERRNEIPAVTDTDTLTANECN